MDMFKNSSIFGPNFGCRSRSFWVLGGFVFHCRFFFRLGSGGRFSDSISTSEDVCAVEFKILLGKWVKSPVISSSEPSESSSVIPSSSSGKIEIVISAATSEWLENSRSFSSSADKTSFKVYLKNTVSFIASAITSNTVKYLKNKLVIRVSITFFFVLQYKDPMKGHRSSPLLTPPYASSFLLPISNHLPTHPTTHFTLASHLQYSKRAILKLDAFR